MSSLKVLFLLLALTCFNQCSVPGTNNGSLSGETHNQAPPVDYKKLIAGRWKCVGHEIYLTFSDRTMTVDYSGVGGKKLVEPYKFKDERTLLVGRYPDNLILNRIPDGEIDFTHDGEKLQESIEMIYFCTFVRPPQ